MTLKLRNAFLRGWFAARSRRQPPLPDGMAEKVYLDSGFDAGVRSAGSALPLLAPVNLNELRAAWDMELELGKLRLQKRYLDMFLPGSGPAPIDLDLRDIAASPPEFGETEPAEPQPAPKSRWDDDEDMPPVNRFLPKKNYNPSLGRGRVRYKG